MIDTELNELARALIAATDRLESEDFKARQARFLEIETERNTLAESLEADEAAVVRAQEALQAHLASGQASCAADLESPPAATTDDPDGIFTLPPEDEYQSARANGAYAGD